MINLSKSGDTIVFEFINNGHYLNNGTIEVPVNSLSLVTDSSNMCTFYRADSHDIFISATYDELGKTKAEMLEWFEENMVAPQGGGGGGVTSGQVQTMIDDSVSGFADSVLYNSTSKYVEFYHGGSGGTKVYEFDASDFVIDGMVDDVRIETISGVSYLVIDFNTASGKEDIQIPLTDIFDPSNYYTKTEVDQALSGKADAIGLDMVGSPRKKVTFQLKSGGVNGTTISSNDLTLGRGLVYGEEGFTTLSTSGLVETSAITSAVTSASTDSEVPSAKAVYDVLSGKADSSAVTQEISAAVSGKQDTLSAGTNITIVDNVISAEGGGKAIEAGRGIAITSGETADTVSFNLPISAGTRSNSIIEGDRNNKATNTYAHAEGGETTASGACSHAEGYYSKASGDYSHAEGESCSAIAEASHAEGLNTYANRAYSHAEGCGTIANNQSEHASGQFNVSNKVNTTFGDSGNTLFSVGNGTSNSARHNAFEIRQNGDIYCSDGTNDVKLQDTITATAANTTALGGLSLVKLTQAQYDALATKDNSTLYVIIN